MLQTLLEQIGLDPTEARVYLAAFKLGTQDAPTLAKATGIPRYDILKILEHLIDRGFVTRFEASKGFFTAEPPRVVLKVLEHTKKVGKKQMTAFEKIIPQFDRYRSPDFTKPQISFYEGKEGIIAAYEDTLTSKTDILAIASIDDTESLLPRYVNKYYQRRKAAGILIKAIFPDTRMARARKEKDKQELRVSRLVPASIYHFNIEMNIYDEKVAYFSTKEQMAVIIQSADIAESMRNMFNLSWHMADLYEERKKLEGGGSENNPFL